MRTGRRAEGQRKKINPEKPLETQRNLRKPKITKVIVKDKVKVKVIVKVRDRDRKSAERFVPPTLDEVAAYCMERQNNVDPKRFFDYFNESNWVDSKGDKVRNWKQKVITWEKSRGGGHSQSAEPVRRKTFSEIIAEREDGA